MNLESKQGIKAIAIFEAVKGLGALCVGIGLLAIINRDFSNAGEELINFLSINRDGTLGQYLIEASRRLTKENIELFLAFAVVYVAMRFIEAYGLWKLRAWAQWFGIISGAVYIPIELYDIYKRPTIFTIGLLFINIVIVAYLIYFRLNQKSRPSEN